MISELAIQYAEGIPAELLCVYILYRHAARGERNQKDMHSVCSERPKLFWKTNPFLSIRLMQLIFRCYSSILTIH